MGTQGSSPHCLLAGLFCIRFYHNVNGIVVISQMFTEHFFELLLNNQEGWRVNRVETNISTEEVRIFVVCDLNKFDYQDQECSLYDHSPSREWRHLDTLQYKTYLVCSLPRVRTKEGKVKTISPPWADAYERHTYLFERMAIDILKATKNQTKTSQLLRCGFNVINRIIHTSTARGLKRRDSSKVVFEELSIDEKSFKKGHNYVSVLSDPKSGCVLDVEQGRDKESCKRLLDKSLTAQQKSQVKKVSMDMWKAFMSGCKQTLPNAKVVHDRFHLVKYLNDAIDKVRRREVKYHDELKESRYALLKSKENLTEKQRIKFEAIRSANYEVSRAWQVRENFKDLFASDPSEAFILFCRWQRDSSLKNIKEITKVVEMFNSHLSGVVEALIYSISNAMAERLNGKIQELKTAGRGYRTFENFRSAILFFNGGLDLYPLN